MIEYGVLLEKEIHLLLELYKQLSPNDEIINDCAVNSIWKEIGKNNIKYYVAKDNGKIIGACYICIIPNLSRGGKSIGFIENVITDINYRRKGIGKNILKNAIGYAKEQNCYKVLLQSGKKRDEAHRFYESIGFNGESKQAFELRFL
jgi:ribosomal protein S18 acetylase RimI-like enzyme